MLNDFLISLLVSDFQRSVWSVPSISVAVLDYIVISVRLKNVVLSEGHLLRHC